MTERPSFEPDWPLTDRVGACTTTRAGGVSRGPFATFNLATHVGDDSAAVAENRARLLARTGCRGIRWLEQVHGTRVVRASLAAVDEVPPRADAAWTDEPGLGVAVLTADCLPVVVAARDGSVVAIAHAGWRGLVDGIVDELLAALPAPPSRLAAWLGPAIGVAAYEVGEDVAGRVMALEGGSTALEPAPDPGKHFLDLSGLAGGQLKRAGVTDVYESGVCVASASSTYSYRRDGVTGRLATVCWIRDG